MSAVIELSEGAEFGHLRVIGRVENDARGNARWLCRCVCGASTTVHGFRLREGQTRSCGCRGLGVNGQSETPTYHCWERMIGRCYRPSQARYKDYGGRGIRVCEEWRHSFAAFLRDMGPKPVGRTIDRIDNDGHYEPANCRWATQREQQLNRRNTVWVEYAGERVKLAVLCEHLGVNRVTVYGRLKIGWPLERALSEPVRGCVEMSQGRGAD